MNDQQVTALIAGQIYAAVRPSTDPAEIPLLPLRCAHEAREIMDAIYKTEPPDADDLVDPEILAKPIGFLGLSPRAKKAIWREYGWDKGDPTIGFLVNMTAEDLICIKNCGITTRQEIVTKLAEHGLKLRGDK